MRALVLASALLVYVLALCVGESSASAPVQVSVEASWPAPAVQVQWLEAVALESPSGLFQFLEQLANTPDSFFQWEATPRNASLLAMDTAKRTPLALTSLLEPDEAYASLEKRFRHSGQAQAYESVLESARMSYALREGSAAIEGMRIMWQDRERELQDPKLECENWADVAGRKVCSEQEFWSVVGRDQEHAQEPLRLPKLPAKVGPLQVFPEDHVTAGRHDVDLPVIIMYAAPNHESFGPLFLFLHHLTRKTSGFTWPGQTWTAPVRYENARIRLIIRWKPLNNAREDEQDRLVLSGFGAELDIKKSDYLVIDDRMSAQDEDPRDESDKLQPVAKEHIRALAVRAASHILNATSPLDEFVSLTGDFPLRAPGLAPAVPEVPSDLVKEVYENQYELQSELQPTFSINGLAIPHGQIDPFTIQRLLRKERRHAQQLFELCPEMTMEGVREAIMHPAITTPASTQHAQRGRISPEVLGDLFDARDHQEGGSLILWWNDLEKDRRYRDWSRRLSDLLKPSYPGSVSKVARNAMNAVLAVDLTDRQMLWLLGESISQYISRSVPVRFGFVPLIDDHRNATLLIAQQLWHVVDVAGRAEAMKFIMTLARSYGPLIDLAYLQRNYMLYTQNAAERHGGKLSFLSSEELEATLRDDLASASSRVNRARAYARRLSLLGGPGVSSCFMNGAYMPINEDFAQVLQRTLSLHMQALQQAVYFEEIDDDADVSSYFYELPNTFGRRNTLIIIDEDINPLRIVNLPLAFTDVDSAFRSSAYIEGVAADDTLDSKGERTTPVKVTMWLVTGLDSDSGRTLIKRAMQFLNGRSDVRISLVHNPGLQSEPSRYSLSTVAARLIRDQRYHELMPSELQDWLELDLTEQVLGQEQVAGWAAENPLRALIDQSLLSEDDVEQGKLFWYGAQAQLLEPFETLPGETALIVNGRIVGPFTPEHFTPEDFADLADYELKNRIQPAIKALTEPIGGAYTPFEIQSLPLARQADIYAFAASVFSDMFMPDPAAGLFGGVPAKRSPIHKRLQSNLTLVQHGRKADAFAEVAVIVDPATPIAQKWAPILKTLSELSGVYTRLHLIPSLNVDSLPIKRFYRYSYTRSVDFDHARETAPSARFDGVPGDTLLTLGLDLQRSWLAFPSSSVYDLDNLRLADLPLPSRERGVRAVYSLEALLVEGHAREMPSSQPPRGLQLELQRGSTVVDTIVMANLGYFQLKAGPGPWDIALRKGKGLDIFEFESIGSTGWKSGPVEETGQSLTVMTLEGLTLYPRLRRRKGQELQDLMDADSGNQVIPLSLSSVIASVRKMLPFSSTKAATVASRKAEINIFTVASGLLYERMAFLMMVSVMRHTKSTVKFWFIQNFLSPSFKAFIPHMAKEYGFDYELVTYKWPHWLREQKEKQRLIWGYKILFLDVLFPLDLDRVIFVDSDQIVRADLKELATMDLEGAPYAYAPMGNDREETKGFRFWETGYWKEHLRGRPYHISALYVVDLKRFRMIAAGDRLRQQYQALSADSGSLANLDQDLPNNMQHQLPIHTLDRSWLWCETWCSDESLASAKTIDLCNNPQTHEPKLQRAKRLIPEWTVYDDEVAALARRVAQVESSLSGSILGGGGSVSRTEAGAAVDAFVKRADELEQAVQQKAEFVGSSSAYDHAVVVSGDEAERPGRQHIKDEL